MYGALADTEPFGGLPYCGTVLNNKIGQLAGPFLDVSLQGQHSPYPDMLHIYAKGGGNMRKKGGLRGCGHNRNFDAGLLVFQGVSW